MGRPDALPHRPRRRARPLSRQRDPGVEARLRPLARLCRQGARIPPHRWPEWFSPTLVEPGTQRFGPFPHLTTLTQAGDVHVVATPGHTPGHLCAALEIGDTVLFLAGDASYTEQHMLDGAADGVAPDPRLARYTLARIHDPARSRPTVYLPTHDPDAVGRLRRMQPAVAASSVEAAA